MAKSSGLIWSSLMARRGRLTFASSLNVRSGDRWCWRFYAVNFSASALSRRVLWHGRTATSFAPMRFGIGSKSSEARGQRDFHTLEQLRTFLGRRGYGDRFAESAALLMNA